MKSVLATFALYSLSALSFISTDAKAETNADGEEITYQYTFEIHAESGKKYASHFLYKSCGEGHSTTLSIRKSLEQYGVESITCAIGVSAGPNSSEMIYADPNTGKNEGYPCVVTDRLYQARVMYVLARYTDQGPNQKRDAPGITVTQTCAKIKPVEKKPF